MKRYEWKRMLRTSLELVFLLLTTVSFLGLYFVKILRNQSNNFVVVCALPSRLREFGLLSVSETKKTHVPIQVPFCRLYGPRYLNIYVCLTNLSTLGLGFSSFKFLSLWTHCLLRGRLSCPASKPSKMYPCLQIIKVWDIRNLVWLGPH